jgi:hypothetical protein
MSTSHSILGVDSIRGGLPIVSDANGIGVLCDAIDIPTIGTGAAERALMWLPYATSSCSISHRRRQLSAHRQCYAGAPPAASNTDGRPAHSGPRSSCALCRSRLLKPRPGKGTGICQVNTRSARQRALELFPAAHALFGTNATTVAQNGAGLHGIRNSRLLAAPPGAQPGSTSNNIQSR